MRDDSIISRKQAEKKQREDEAKRELVQSRDLIQYLKRECPSNCSSYIGCSIYNDVLLGYSRDEIMDGRCVEQRFVVHA